MTMCSVVCDHVMDDSVCDHVWCGVFFMVFLIRFYPDIYDLGGFKCWRKSMGRGSATRDPPGRRYLPGTTLM